MKSHPKSGPRVLVILFVSRPHTRAHTHAHTHANRPILHVYRSNGLVWVQTIFGADAIVVRFDCRRRCDSITANYYGDESVNVREPTQWNGSSTEHTFAQSLQRTVVSSWHNCFFGAFFRAVNLQQLPFKGNSHRGVLMCCVAHCANEATPQLRKEKLPLSHGKWS